ncbi:hypothetical protein DPMN_148251 [Dreissena polymorpha]|uniref:Uncharacterized protein n=1 Tax=Dreissena polymorpha TaxID=45954 RepID=A0A9D4FC50_DREPO|nr:hypothetical protein DPMN_148251 [Dreissena polymorpha]
MSLLRCSKRLNVLSTCRNTYPAAHGTSVKASSLLTLKAKAVVSLTQKAAAKRDTELLVREAVVSSAVGSSFDIIWTSINKFTNIASMTNNLAR